MSISDQFKADIETSLGGGLVDVELSQAEYDFAFDKSKRIFIQRGNNNMDKKFISFNAIPDTTVYTLPSAENIDTIVRIIKRKSSLSPADPFSVATMNEMFSSMYSSGSNSMANFELSLQAVDNINIYLLYDTQFIWKKRNNELTLLDNPKIDETWYVECFADLSDEEYEENIWIRNYTMAECKIILGNAYRKFSSLTAPSGETSLAGSEMIQEGKEEQLALLENIGDYIDGDIAGSVFLIG